MTELPHWFKKVERLIRRDGLRETARQLGIHPATLWNWVNGHRTPRPLAMEGLRARLEKVR